MNADSAQSAMCVGRPSRSETLRAALFVGWFVGTMLTLYVVPHPLLHAEGENQEWRVAAAGRSLAIAPFTYLGPPLLAVIVAAIRHRRGWDSSELLRPLRSARRKVSLPITLTLLGAHAILAFVVAYFRHVVARG